MANARFADVVSRFSDFSSESAGSMLKHDSRFDDDKYGLLGVKMTQVKPFQRDGHSDVAALARPVPILSRITSIQALRNPISRRLWISR